MTMKAIPYARFSSLEQSHGSTLQRQEQLNEAFCARMGWTIVARECDEGLSAYTGQNLHTGRLGALTSRLEKEGGSGVAIVVEKLDRLSRQPPLVMTNWLQRICATGATIATADGKHLIDQAGLTSNLMGIMAVMFEAFVGYQESANKSDRGLENWRLKRESGKPMTSRCPAWLRLNADRTAYELIPDRAEIVVRICKLRAQRVHKDRIAAMLDDDGIPPWGGGKRWYGSYIQKITSNIALVGDHMHGMKRRSDKRRTFTGEVVKGYFPAVIDEALFEQINSNRHQSAANAQRKGHIANLFTGLARCSCGSIMTFRAKGTKVRSDGRHVREDYLRCDSAFRPGRGGDCQHRTSYNYATFREAVLDQLLHRALDDQHFRMDDDADKLEMEVATKRRETDSIQRRMAAAFGMVEEDPDDSHARTRYRTLKLEWKQAKADLQDAQSVLEQARGAVSPSEHLARVADVRDLMDARDDAVRDEARARVKMALNDLIERCVFDAQREQAAITLVGGVGLLLVAKDGRTGWFDLVKEGRDYEEGLDPEAVDNLRAYLKRRAA